MTRESPSHLLLDAREYNQYAEKKKGNESNTMSQILNISWCDVVVIDERNIWESRNYAGLVFMMRS